MQSLAFASSFVTIVLKSITWHHLELAKTETLSLGLKVKVAPFFLSSISMKTFVSGTCICFLINTKYWYLAIVFVTLLWAYQVILLKCLGFKNPNVANASFANVTSLARPNTDTGLIDCTCFYVIETQVSSLLYLVLSVIPLLTMPKNEEEMVYLYICLSLTLYHHQCLSPYLMGS